MPQIVADRSLPRPVRAALWLGAALAACLPVAAWDDLAVPALGSGESLQPAEYRAVVRQGDTEVGPGGIVVRTAAADRATGAALAIAAASAREGLAQAQQILHDELGLPRPEPFEVIVVRRGGQPVHWSQLPRRRTRLLVVDPAAGQESEVGRTLLAPYAATVLAAAPRGWDVAVGHWLEWRITGQLSVDASRAATRRLARLDVGLARPDAAGGDLVWLSMIEELHGSAVLGDALSRLTSGETPMAALEGALRIAGSSLEAAFRELHLWSLLTGERDDGHHFPFGSALGTLAFASTEQGLPALSLQTNPAVGPWGATQMRIVPEADRGGLRLSLEGEYPGRWGADVIVRFEDGNLHRIPIGIDEGRGDVRVPLQNVAELWLLARRSGTAEGMLRYTVAALHEKGYPVEFVSLDARPARIARRGVSLRWETSSEEDVVAFDVLRRARGGDEQVITPVLIPALGDGPRGTVYQFLDTATDAGIDYEYRVRAVTASGLTAISDPVSPDLR